MKYHGLLCFAAICSAIYTYIVLKDDDEKPDIPYDERRHKVIYMTVVATAYPHVLALASKHEIHEIGVQCASEIASVSLYGHIDKIDQFTMKIKTIEGTIMVGESTK